MSEQTNIRDTPKLVADEEHLLECYRRCSDAGRRQLAVFAEMFSAMAKPLPDNVIQFPAN